MILTAEQEMIRDSIRAFAQERLAPFAAEWDRDHTFPRDALNELAGLGALGMVVPEEWGGAGMDYMSLVLALEEIAAGDGATSTIVSVQNSLPCGILNRFGNDAQKEAWLKPLARGEKLGCFCLTEPHVGSDAAAIRSTAVRDGNEWVLNGVKQFITTGKHADVAIVFAVTDKAAGKKGITCFLVPANAPGYQVGRIEEKMGQKASDTTQILFENCRIPADSVIGAEGEGYRIALANLEAGRIGIAAQCLGMARAALEAAVKYAQERESFGKPIFEHQAVNFRLADMATQLEAARQLVWHAASLKDAGRPCLKEASMAKLFASEMAERDAVGGLRHSRSWHATMNAITESESPVIAVLQGGVIGGGLELALAAHYRVAADVRGSLEAIVEAISKLKSDRVSARVIHSGVGEVTENDVVLAAASNAIILGFHVRAMPGINRLAKQKGVDLRLCSIIYDLLQQVEDAMRGQLQPESRETPLGSAEIIQIFEISKAGKICGCRVTSGVIRVNAKAKVYRDKELIYHGHVASLKHFKNDVREIKSGLECGIRLDNFEDFEVHDIIEAFDLVQVAPQL